MTAGVGSEHHADATVTCLERGRGGASVLPWQPGGCVGSHNNVL